MTDRPPPTLGAESNTLPAPPPTWQRLIGVVLLTATLGVSSCQALVAALW